MNAMPYSGTDLQHAQLAGAPNIAAVQRVLPGLTQANSAEWTPAAPPPASVVNDALWSQHFCNIELGDEHADELRDYISGMPTQAQSALHAWTQAPFAAVYNIPAGIANAGEFTPIYLRVNEDDQSAANNSANAHIGTFANRKYNLPVFNLRETSQIRVTAGINHWRSLRPGDNSWPDDAAALSTAAQLVRLGANALLSRAVNIAIQWRAAADLATYATELSPAVLLTANGIPTTGSAALDLEIQDTTSEFRAGTMREIFKNYLSAVSEGVQRTGYPMAIAEEQELEATTFAFYPATEFEYPSADDSARDRHYITLTQLRVLHPIVVQSWLPDAPIPGLPLTNETMLLAIPTHQTEAPWTSWDLAGTQLTLAEALSALRILFAASGVRIQPRLEVSYLGEGGARPTYYQVAQEMSRRPPRLSDTFPHTPFAAQDFLTWMSTCVPLNIEHRDEQNNVTYVSPGPMLGFLSMAHPSNVAPMLEYRRSQLAATVLVPAPNTIGDIAPVGLGVNVAYGADADALPGMWSAPGMRYISRLDSHRTTHYRASQPWFSMQVGSNPAVMRSWPALNSAEPRLIQRAAASAPIEDAAGNPFTPAIFGAAPTQNARTLVANDNLITYVPWGTIPPGDVAVALNRILGQASARANTWRIKPEVISVPMVLTDREPTGMAQATNMMIPQSTNTRYLYSQLNNSSTAKYLAGLGSDPSLGTVDANPLPQHMLPDNPNVVSFADPTVLDRQRYDNRVLAPAFSGVSAVPLPSLQLQGVDSGNSQPNPDKAHLIDRLTAFLAQYEQSTERDKAAAIAAQAAADMHDKNNTPAATGFRKTGF